MVKKRDFVVKKTFSEKTLFIFFLYNTALLNEKRGKLEQKDRPRLSHIFSLLVFVLKVWLGG